MSYAKIYRHLHLQMQTIGISDHWSTVLSASKISPPKEGTSHRSPNITTQT